MGRRRRESFLLEGRCWTSLEGGNRGARGNGAQTLWRLQSRRVRECAQPRDAQQRVARADGRIDAQRGLRSTVAMTVRGEVVLPGTRLPWRLARTDERGVRYGQRRTLVVSGPEAERGSGRAREDLDDDHRAAAV